MSGEPHPGTGEQSLGELVASATSNLSSLMRQEVELAKVEIKRDVTAAVKGAGMLGGAGVAGLYALGFLSVGLAYALGELVPLGAGFAVVGGLYLLVAAVLGLKGRSSVAEVGPPEKTIATVKDDLAWAKHPTQSLSQDRTPTNA